MTTLAFLHGALTLGCAAVAVFFARYYRLTQEPLFVWFTFSFVMFALQWAVLSLGVFSEHAHVVYAIRLIGFLSILGGIIRKNRPARPTPDSAREHGEG